MDGSHGGGERGQEGLSIPRLSSTPSALSFQQLLAWIPWRKNPGVGLSGQPRSHTRPWQSVLRHQGGGRWGAANGRPFLRGPGSAGPALPRRGGRASWQGAPAKGPLLTGGGGSIWEGAVPLVPDPWVGEVYPSGHQDGGGLRRAAG